LLASAKAFSAFFALASADLCDFSALALAAVATSKAFREALSSASSDAMRALADARASAFQQRKERSQTNSKKKHTGQAKTRQKNIPSEAFATFRYSAHSVPEAMNFFINAWQKKDA
jgi:hypothetical protein